MVIVASLDNFNYIKRCLRERQELLDMSNDYNSLQTINKMLENFLSQFEINLSLLMYVHYNDIINKITQKYKLKIKI
jgi:hypothetical protein